MPELASKKFAPGTSDDERASRQLGRAEQTINLASMANMTVEKKIQSAYILRRAD
jgi:hypothetical protein